MNDQQAIWLLFVSEYDFEIKHIKGKENKVAYDLSRHSNLVYMTASSSYEIDLEDKIMNTAETDENYKIIKRKIMEGEAENEESDFRIRKNGLLMYT